MSDAVPGLCVCVPTVYSEPDMEINVRATAFASRTWGASETLSAREAQRRRPGATRVRVRERFRDARRAMEGFGWCKADPVERGGLGRRSASLLRTALRGHRAG